MYVLPFSMGPIGSPMSQIGVQLTDSPYVVVNMRIMARIGLPVFDEIDKDVKRVVPCMHSRRRAARARPEGRALALQQGKIHRPFSGDARDLVLRLRLRRQRAARQEMFRAAHRLQHRARRRLAGRAHAHPRRRKSPRAKRPTSPPRFPAPAARPISPCWFRPPRFEGWKVWTVGDDIAWIKPGRGRPPARHQSRGRLLRRRARHHRSRPIPTPWPRWRETPSSPTSRSRPKAASGGKA